MDSIKNLGTFWRGFLTLLALAAGLYILWLVRSILIYLVISGILSLLGRPLVQFISQPFYKAYSLPKAVAALLVLLLELGIIAGLVFLTVPLVASEITYWNTLDTEPVTTALQEKFAFLQQWLSTNGQMAEVEQVKTELFNLINLSQVSATFSTLAGGLGNVFMALFSVLFITFFFLKDHLLPRKILLRIIPSQYHQNLGRIVPTVRNLLTRYFLGLLVQLLSITLLVALGLHLVGLEQVWVIAVFAGLINVIPYIGPLIGASFGLVLGLLHNVDNPDLLGLWALKIAGVFAVIQLLDNFVFQPVIYSNSVKAHPLEIFLVISVAGTLAGIAGMVVAVPLYSALRVVVGEILSHRNQLKQVRENEPC